MSAHSESRRDKVKRRVANAHMRIVLHHSGALQAHADIEEERERIYCRVAGGVQEINAAIGTQCLTHTAHRAVVAVGLIAQQSQSETGVGRVGAVRLCDRLAQCPGGDEEEEDEGIFKFHNDAFVMLRWWQRIWFNPRGTMKWSAKMQLFTLSSKRNSSPPVKKTKRSAYFLRKAAI